MQLVAQNIHHELKTFYSDIKFCKNTVSVQGLLASFDNPSDSPLSTEEWLNHCETTAISFLNSKPDYLKIKLLNDSGIEIQRVERLQGKVVVTRPEDLQDKSEQEYVKVIQNKHHNEVYISDLNLNQENGEIQKPYTPTLRYGIPLISKNGAKKLLFIISVNAHTILDKIKEHSHTQTYIIDREGYYIHHPDKDYHWSKDLNTNQKMQNEFPGFDSIMQSLDENTLHLQKSKQILGYHKIYFDPENATRYWTIFEILPENEVFSKVNHLEKKAFLSAGLIGLCVLIISFLSVRTFTHPIQKLATASEKVSHGNLDIEVHLDRSDELGQFSQTFNRMVQNLKQSHQQMQDQNRLKTSLNEILNTAQGIHDLNKLCQVIINELSALVQAGYGVFYLKVPQNGKNHDTLHMTAAYGITDSVYLKSDFKPGEGLVGQCALLQTSVMQTDLPEDYTRIQSGLGEKKPSCVILEPILFEKNVIGVVELASFRLFSEFDKDLLKHIISSLGVIIHNVFSRNETERLLGIAQTMEEELRVQQEELQASNAELEARTEALETKKNDVERKNTELEKAHKEIERKAYDLTIASRYKSEFLANMSHELRTPLNSLLILSELFASNEDGNLTESQKEEAKIIHEGGMELLHLINNILDLSKIEAGKLAVENERIDLTDFLNTIKRHFDPIARKKNLDFQIHKDDNVPNHVLTDSIRLNQIVKNLLSNALKFTEKGNVTLHISISDVLSDHKTKHKHFSKTIIFSIKDTGIGIPEDKQSIIFESFQQADGSTSRKYGGTGLGLTICRELARLLEGRIELTSTHNEGSEFKLVLPLYTQNTKDTHTQTDTESTNTNDDRLNFSTQYSNHLDDTSLKEKSILIIEDDINFSKLLSDFALKNNYKSFVANTGKKGIELAERKTPTAIFLDADLPDLSGLSVLNILKSHSKTKHIPVHIISGKSASDFKLEEGNVDVLLKPISKESLTGIFHKIELSLNNKIKRILLVEDDLNCQSALKKILSEKNIHLDVSGRGEDALHKLITTYYDCVIMDLQLPDISGEEILERLRLSSHLKTPPIIIYTGRELTKEEHQNLLKYTTNIVIKGELSKDRLIDELSLFLHRVENKSEDFDHTPIDSYETDVSLKEKRVLLVDDDLKNVFALSKVLQKKGIQVVIADNGELALKRLEENPHFDLIIMDIMMPVMDGYTAIRKIRENHTMKSISILALTAKAMPEDRDKCLQAGANDYLTKPVEIPKLLSSLRVWLSK